MNNLITISIVSHQQGQLVMQILADLEKFCADQITVILTINKHEDKNYHWEKFSFPIKVIVNTKPKGFAENHNAAFEFCSSNIFCVMNPDVRLMGNPFTVLIPTLNQPQVGVVAPLIVNEAGLVEDSARKFPTPISLLKRYLIKNRNTDYPIVGDVIYPDWLAGMFMLFNSEIFKKINGFDEAYFLYCEDIDLCARLRALNYKIVLNPQVSVIHQARRASHRNMRFLKWHVTSLLRFFFRYYGWGYKYKAENL
jgi:hypothetical protein